MRRREFITLLGGAAAAWPIAASAQQPRPGAAVGVLGRCHGFSHRETSAPLRFAQRLRELGWIEGRTVTIEYHWAEGRIARLAEIAAKFVSAQGRCHSCDR